MSEGVKARWGDLGMRIVSGVVLAVIAIAALWGGQMVWTLFVLAILCAGFWELARLCEPGITPKRRLLVGILPVIGILPAFGLGLGVSEAEGLDLASRVWAEEKSAGLLTTVLVGGVIVSFVMLVQVVQERALQGVLYGAVLLGAGGFLVVARSENGVNAVLALLAIVVISDVAGYFAGRMIGGPKFWPAVSPKKTWSGTIAGWVGAGVFGALVLPGFGVGVQWAVPLAVVLCFAAQMGDIIESAMKRKAGIKDSSNLIPGHGGVLDRMDGMVGAAAVAALIMLIAA
ncbi:phosphatidate cytidylyltransferase [Rhodobacteraceae bacterium D3-12]|nr:phosphatidate cytidylyltransferase [Rhodobacteraceae bacterium D3-12]